MLAFSAGPASMTLNPQVVLDLVTGNDRRVVEAEQYAKDLEGQVSRLENELTKVEIEVNELEDELSDLRKVRGLDPDDPLRKAVVDAIAILTEAVGNG